MGKRALVLRSEVIRGRPALSCAGNSVILLRLLRYRCQPLSAWNRSPALWRRTSTVSALRKALEAAGIEFIDENGGGPGVRLRKRQLKRSR